MSQDEHDYKDLVAIRTFSTHSEADVLAAVLRNAGIRAVVPMEQNVFTDVEVMFQGGLPVLIRPEDRDKAEAAIAEAKATGDWMEEHPGDLPDDRKDGG